MHPEFLSRFAPAFVILFAAVALISCAKQPPASILPAPRVGDEGMWPLNNLPLKDLKDRYSFIPTGQWLKNVQLSAVRFNDGGSGSFASADGLVITNHHVALGQLQKLSTPERNYARDGLFARTPQEELRCPDLELNVLVSMDDVTARVQKAIDPKASPEKQNRQRKAEIARIEKESTETTRLRSDVVELYQGGQYWLYRYKRYTDVRIVMAPEADAANFGGDPDNFGFPRYALDFAFFRVYENDKPARVEHYLKWNPAGAKEGDLVFVAGHPGNTDRLMTVAQLEYERDHSLPKRLRMLESRRAALRQYAARGPEQARQVFAHIEGVENGLKALRGELEGLKDPAIFDRLANAEKSLRAAVRQRPGLRKMADDAWGKIARVMRERAKRSEQAMYYPLGASRMVDIARNIVRYVHELQKPNEDRYEEYRDSDRESLDLRLFSPAPLYPELEEAMLAYALAEAQKNLPKDDKFIKAALNGQSPQDLSRDLISRTRLFDPRFRRQLVEGGVPAIEKSDDPLIACARKLDPIWRELRDWQENKIQPVEVIQGGNIAKARFAIYGEDAYPDATFTLRLSFGRVAGYEQLTSLVPYKTTFFGLFARSAAFDNQPPFNLAGKISASRPRIDMASPMDFVSTNDIIGGNSGSPVIDREGRFVGIIFDGNIQSLVWAYAYTDRDARAVSVHVAAILEALRNVYDMEALAKELTE